MSSCGLNTETIVAKIDSCSAVLRTCSVEVVTELDMSELSARQENSRVERNTVHAAQASRAKFVTAFARSNSICCSHRSDLHAAPSSVRSS